MNDVCVKICGLTTEDDIYAAIDAGADLVGMVVNYPKSRRNISMAQAEYLISALDEEMMLRESEDVDTPDVSVVAVTVSPTADDILDVANAGFDYIQIHGELRQDVIDLYEGDIMPQIIRAYNHIDDSVLEEIRMLSDRMYLFAFLFDAPEPGSGKGFDWDTIPKDLEMPFFLAGGLTPENVTAAVRTVRPFAVDVSSGVEKSPLPTEEEIEAGESMKDYDRMRAFVKAARA